MSVRFRLGATSVVSPAVNQWQPEANRHDADTSPLALEERANPKFISVNGQALTSGLVVGIVGAALVFGSSMGLLNPDPVPRKPIIVNEQQDRARFQPAPVVFTGPLALFERAIVESREQPAAEEQRYEQRQPITFGSHAPRVPVQPDLKRSHEQRGTQRTQIDGRGWIFSPQPAPGVAPSEPPMRPAVFAVPEQFREHRAPVVFGAPYLAPTQPSLKRPWEQRATHQPAFVGGRALVFGSPLLPSAVVVPPLRPALFATERQRQDQPAAVVFGAPPASIAAAQPQRYAIVVREQPQQHQWAPVVRPNAALFAPAQPELKKGWEQRATQRVEVSSGSAVIFKPVPAAAVVAEQPRGMLVAAPQDDQRQPGAVLFGHGPEHLTPPPLRPLLTALALQDQTQPAPEVFGTVPLPPVPLKGALVARPFEQFADIAPRVFGQTPPSYDLPPLGPSKVVNAAQAQEQPAARLFGALHLPSAAAPPLRPSLIAPPQADPTQIAAQLFRQPPPVTPSAPLRPLFVAPEQASGWQPAARVFGTLPVVAPPLRTAIVVVPQLAGEIAAQVFRAQIQVQASPPTKFIVAAHADTTQRAPVVFGTLPYQAPPLRGVVLAAPQADPTQIPALWFGAPHMPTVFAPPLRPAWIAPEQASGWQPGARIDGQWIVTPGSPVAFAPLSAGLLFRRPSAESRPGDVVEIRPGSANENRPRDVNEVRSGALDGRRPPNKGR